MKNSVRKTSKTVKDNTSSTKLVSAPIAKTKIVTIERPQFGYKRHSILVKHKEYVTSVFGTNAPLRNVTGVCNPSNAGSFPWLSTLAFNFDKYRFVRLHYEFVPSCPTTTPGRVAMYFDTDVASTPPTNKAELHSFEGVVDAPSWSSVALRVRCDNVIRFADQAQSDPRLVDLGQITIATYGTGSSVDIGDVYVDYEIELIRPVGGKPLATYYVGGNANSVLISGPVYATIAGTTGITFTALTTGTFNITITAAGAGLVTGTPTPTGSSSVARVAVITNATNVQQLATFVWSVGEVGDTVTLPFGAIPTSIVVVVSKVG